MHLQLNNKYKMISYNSTLVKTILYLYRKDYDKNIWTIMRNNLGNMYNVH
jgi:hypothetical protein